MKKLTYLVFTIVLVTSCTATKKYKSIWDLPPISNKEFSVGTGLLALMVNPVGMTSNHIPTKKVERLTHFTLKNIKTGKIKTIKQSYGKAIVVSLPAGRYCIGEFRTYVNLTLNHCKAPFFDVESNSVEIGGVITLGINYNGQRSNITHTILDVNKQRTLIDTYITNNGREEINNISSNFNSDVFPKSLYLTSSFGREKVLIMDKDGSSELKSYAKNIPFYTKGTWSSNEGQYIFSFYKGSTEYRVKKYKEGYTGLVTISYNSDTLDREHTDNWLFNVSSNLLNVNNNFSLVDSVHTVIARGFSYPEKAYKQSEEGDVQLDITLTKDPQLPKGNVFKPYRVEVKSSDFNLDINDFIVEKIMKFRYSVPLSNKRHKITESMSFTINNDKANINYHNSLSIIFNNL